MRERTMAVHGPQVVPSGSLTTPIEQTTTFVLSTADEVDDVYDGRRPGDTYTRDTNPTLRSLAARLAQLEGAQAAEVTASGMGAISTTLLTLVPAGGRIVATRDLYGTTMSLLRFLRDRHGVRVDLVPTTEPEALRAALREKTDLVYLETPTNPTLRLVDLAASAEAARAAGVTTVVDGTFASPVNCRPLELGIDVVVHAATKYLAGHSDVMAGVVCGSRDLVARVHATHKLVGAVLDPHAAFLVERGLRTLPMRVAAANANAQRVAEALAATRGVRAVHYPGLPSHPQHALAKRQMRGFGGVVSFDLASFEEAKRFLDALRLVRNAASLGGTESLCSLPVQQSHRKQPPEALESAGITPGTVRLALGVEDAEDLVEDVTRAVKAATS